jgi:molecular chaperone DnaJ
MTQREDYNEILGVETDASPRDIRAARNSKAFVFHPDRFRKAPEAARLSAQEKMKKVNRAYEVLSRPDRRERYQSK